MANEKLPPIEGELTDEDLKQVCGGTGPYPRNGQGGNSQGQDQGGNSQGP